MELELLVVLETDGEGEGTRSLDVAVRLPADATVAMLHEALAGFARRSGQLPRTASTALGLYRVGDRDALPPAQRVIDSGVLSGDALVLRPVGGGRGRGSRRPGPETSAALPSGASAVAALPGASGTATMGDGALDAGAVLDVVGGPDSGTSVALELGALTVGRSSRCRLVVHDPTLSRHHFTLQVAAKWGGGLEVVVVPDASARNGVLVEGKRIEGPCDLSPGELLRAGDSVFLLRSTSAARDAGLGSGRVVPQRRDLGGVRSAPPRPIGSFAASRRFTRQRAAFYEQVERMATRVDQALRAERAERHAAAPDLALLARRADRRADQAGHRRRGSAPGPAPTEQWPTVYVDMESSPIGGQGADVAASGRPPAVHGDLAPATASGSGRTLAPLRVGLGEVASRITVGVAPGGTPELRRQANERLAHHRTLADAPITIDLQEVGALGICGDVDQAVAATRALVLQAACLHGPDQLVVAAALGEQHRDWFDWLKWLPHVRSPTSPLDGDALAVGPDAAAEMMGHVLDLVADRLSHPAPGPHGAWPRVVLAVDHEAEVPSWLLDRVLAVAPAHGIHVVWFGESELLVPRQCGAVLTCSGSGKQARLRLATDDGGAGPGHGDGAVLVDLDGVQPATARSIARRLASADVDSTAHLPRRVPLLDVVSLGRPGHGTVVERWRTARVDSLQCIVGVTAEGACRIDLARQGPNMVIGGARGSGKTEALLAVALSLAAHHPPRHLRFVVLDYGRDAGTEVLRGLPHTMRWLTPADGAGAVRQTLDELPTLPWDGPERPPDEPPAARSAVPPPRLVVLVDDHAALARQLPWAPAVLAGLAGWGGRARTHLVLTSPYPVDLPSPCWARTGLRLALRATDPAAATNLVGVAHPADLPAALRGRGYLRIGTAAPIPVQCAWPSAPEPEPEHQPVTVAPFAVGQTVSQGHRPEIPPADGTPAPTPARSHALAVVDACTAAAAHLVQPPAR